MANNISLRFMTASKDQQGFLLMFSKTLNLWKTLLEYRSQNFFEDTVRNKIHVEHRRILNVYKLRTEVFCKQIQSLVERQNLPREVQWQISLPSPRYYQSNEPVILICVFVKISTNPSPRVRSWPWRLHESEIQVQSFATRVFTASRLSRSSLMRRKIKKNLWDQGKFRRCTIIPRWVSCGGIFNMFNIFYIQWWW